MEEFDVFDEAGRHVGTAPRSECHGNPALIHRTAHVVVFSPDGRSILLQKRSQSKDIQPGKWDTAVGGHLQLGETPLEGAKRELAEELGIREAKLTFLFESRIRNEIESENVRVFGLISSGPFSFQQEEIDEVRFWSIEELKNPANFSCFTPNLCHELEILWARGGEDWLKQPARRGVPSVGLRFVLGFLFGMMLASIGELFAGAGDSVPKGWFYWDCILPFLCGVAAMFFLGRARKTGKGEEK